MNKNIFFSIFFFSSMHAMELTQGNSQQDLNAVAEPQIVTDLLNLPGDMHYEIGEHLAKIDKGTYLDRKSLAAFTQTCKKLYELRKNEELKKIYKQQQPEREKLFTSLNSQLVKAISKPRVENVDLEEVKKLLAQGASVNIPLQKDAIAFCRQKSHSYSSSEQSKNIPLQDGANLLTILATNYANRYEWGWKNEEYNLLETVLNYADQKNKEKTLLAIIPYMINHYNSNKYLNSYYFDIDHYLSSKIYVLDLLIKSGINPNIKNGSNETLLHWDILFNGGKNIESLLSQGADIDARNSNGETPLHFAVWSKCEKAINLLTQHGANLALPNNQGLIPLYLPQAYKPYFIKLMKDTPIDVQETMDIALKSESNPLLEFAVIRGAPVTQDAWKQVFKSENMYMVKFLVNQTTDLVEPLATAQENMKKSSAHYERSKDSRYEYIAEQELNFYTKAVKTIKKKMLENSSNPLKRAWAKIKYRDKNNNNN